MTNDLPPASLHGLGSVQPGNGSDRPKSAEVDPNAGAHFKALLENLQDQARELGEDSERVDGPEDLAGIVDRAKSSLDDAIALRDQLVEAYREALLRGEVPSDEAPTNEAPADGPRNPGSSR